MPANRNQRFVQITIAVLTWAALILQFYLQIVNRTTEVSEAVVRYFSYFTILTNLLVAVCFTCLLLKNGKGYHFFSRASVVTAVTAYILIVGIVYNIVLRSLWDPQGLQLLADNLLHTITPLLTLIYWFVYVPTKEISWKQTVTWMLYPFCYLIYVMILGSFSNFYPYFFINAATLGYAEAILNSVYVTFCFLAVSLLLIWLGKKKKV